jgi:hypothetical protein
MSLFILEKSDLNPVSENKDLSIANTGECREISKYSKSNVLKADFTNTDVNHTLDVN